MWYQLYLLITLSTNQPQQNLLNGGLEWTIPVVYRCLRDMLNQFWFEVGLSHNQNSCLDQLSMNHNIQWVGNLLAVAFPFALFGLTERSFSCDNKRLRVVITDGFLPNCNEVLECECRIPSSNQSFRQSLYYDLTMASWLIPCSNVVSCFTAASMPSNRRCGVYPHVHRPCRLFPKLKCNSRPESLMEKLPLSYRNQNHFSFSILAVGSTCP